MTKDDECADGFVYWANDKGVNDSRVINEAMGILTGVRDEVINQIRDLIVKVNKQSDINLSMDIKVKVTHIESGMNTSVSLKKQGSRDET